MAGRPNWWLGQLVLALFVALFLLGPKPSDASSPSLVTWDALAAQLTSDNQGSRPAVGAASSQGVLDSEISIDGYVLPLVWEADRVVEFLLVPWVGACIHTPSPAPDQIIYVTYPEGLTLKRQFEAVRLKGMLRHDPAERFLFHVDGSREVPVSYTLDGAETFGRPGRIVAVSASELPLLARLQVWVNSLFTDSMTALGNGGSIKAFAFAMLLSLGYGALHTFGPGHGKTVVVSYFVGTGGSLWRGLGMGVRIALFHVISAVVVVFLLDFAVRQATGSAPSDYRAIRLASYALIVAIGSVMLWRALMAVRTNKAIASDHSHSHDHEGHDHSGCAACASAATATRGDGWIAAAVGVVPCTGALIVMLFGLANDLVWPAIAMVAAISLGMAVAMSAIGIAALLGRSWAEHRLVEGSDRRQRFELGARLTGAVCVLATGLLLFGVTVTSKPLAAVPAGNAVIHSADAVGPTEQSSSLATR